MEKYKHAPGPWTAEPSLATMPFVIRDARGWSVAYVTGVADTGTAPDNARLIKEAPALLEALTNLCLAVLTVRVSGPKDVPELVEPHEWAMHVLAQARGLA